MPESKEYSWAWVTADRLLTEQECELIYAHLVASDAETNTHLRNGVNASADIVVTLKSAVVTGLSFSPPVPVFCRRGLFADIGADTSGLFVMWRNL